MIKPPSLETQFDSTNSKYHQCSRGHPWLTLFATSPVIWTLRTDDFPKFFLHSYKDYKKKDPSMIKDAREVIFCLIVHILEIKAYICILFSFFNSAIFIILHHKSVKTCAFTGSTYQQSFLWNTATYKM